MVVKKTAPIQELGSKRFTISNSELGNVSFVKDIQIAPILGTPSGDQVGRAVDEMKLSKTEILKGLDRKSTRLNSSHIPLSRMPSSA